LTDQLTQNSAEMSDVTPGRLMSAPVGSEYSAMYSNAGLSVACGSDTCLLVLDEYRGLLVVIEKRVLIM